MSLTEDGLRLFQKLDRVSGEAVATLIEGLSPARLEELLDAMSTVRRLLSPETTQPDYRLRPLRVGDIGWIMHRQGVLYAEEYGWDATLRGAGRARPRHRTAPGAGMHLGRAASTVSKCVQHERLQYRAPARRGLRR